MSGRKVEQHLFKALICIKPKKKNEIQLVILIINKNNSRFQRELAFHCLPQNVSYSKQLKIFFFKWRCAG